MQGRAAFFGDQRGFDGCFASREHFANSPFDQRLLFGGEEIERMHVRDLLCRVPGDSLEVSVPAQEPTVLVIDVEDPRQGFDETAGEPLVDFRKLLCALVLSELARGRFVVGEVVQGRRDVVAGCGQQIRRGLEASLPARTFGNLLDLLERGRQTIGQLDF